MEIRILLTVRLESLPYTLYSRYVQCEHYKHDHHNRERQGRRWQNHYCRLSSNGSALHTPTVLLDADSQDSAFEWFAERTTDRASIVSLPRRLGRCRTP